MEINSKIMYYLNKTLLSLEPWELRPKKFQTNVAVSPAPVRVPSQSPLAPSVASVTSVTNDKGDNDGQVFLEKELVGLGVDGYW